MVALLLFFFIFAKVSAWEDLANIPGSFVGIYDQYSAQCICIPANLFPNLYSPSPTATMVNQLIINPPELSHEPRSTIPPFSVDSIPPLLMIEPSPSPEIEPTSPPSFTVEPSTIDEFVVSFAPTTTIEPSFIGVLDPSFEPSTTNEVGQSSPSPATGEIETTSPPTFTIQPSTIDEFGFSSKPTITIEPYPNIEIDASSLPSISIEPYPLELFDVSSAPTSTMEQPTTGDIEPAYTPSFSLETSRTDEVDPSSAAAPTIEPSTTPEIDPSSTPDVIDASSPPTPSFFPGIDPSAPPTLAVEPSTPAETEATDPEESVSSSPPPFGHKPMEVSKESPTGNETQPTTPEPSFTIVMLPRSTPDLSDESTSTTTTPQPVTVDEEPTAFALPTPGDPTPGVFETPTVDVSETPSPDERGPPMSFITPEVSPLVETSVPTATPDALAESPDFLVHLPSPPLITISQTPEAGLTEEPAPSYRKIPIGIDMPAPSFFPDFARETLQYSPEPTAPEVIEESSAPQETTAVAPSMELLLPFPTPVVTTVGTLVTTDEPTPPQVSDDPLKPHGHLDNSFIPEIPGSDDRWPLPGFSSPPTSEEPTSLPDFPLLFISNESESSPVTTDEPSPEISGASTAEPTSTELPDADAIPLDASGGPIIPKPSSVLAPDVDATPGVEPSLLLDIIVSRATPEPSSVETPDVDAPTSGEPSSSLDISEGPATPEPSSTDVPDVDARTSPESSSLVDASASLATPEPSSDMDTTYIVEPSSPINVSGGQVTPEPSTLFLPNIGPTPFAEPSALIGESDLPDAAETPETGNSAVPSEAYEPSASETPEPTFEAKLIPTIPVDVTETAEPSSPIFESLFPPESTPGSTVGADEPPIGTLEVPGGPTTGTTAVRKPTITPKPPTGGMLVPMPMPTKTPMVPKRPIGCDYKPWKHKVLVLEKKGEKRKLLGISCVNGEFRYCELQEHKKIIAQKEVTITVYGNCLSECESEKIDSYFKMELVKEYYVGGKTTGWIVKPRTKIH